MVDTYENGLGNGLFGWSSTLRLHALYRDAFGRIYLKTKKGPGYTYVFRNYIFNGSNLFGHLPNRTVELYFIWEKYRKNDCK